MKESARLRDRFQVFVSHASTDTWLARQIAGHVKRCGAACFLDDNDIDHGDEFEETIRKAAKSSREMVLLLTPWATSHPYVWVEVGTFWHSKKRIVAVLHGLTAEEVSRSKLPVFLKGMHHVTLNEIDSYFAQLRRRVLKWTSDHA